MSAHPFVISDIATAQKRLEKAVVAMKAGLESGEPWAAMGKALALVKDAQHSLTCAVKFDEIAREREAEDERRAEAAQ